MRILLLSLAVLALVAITLADSQEKDSQVATFTAEKCVTERNSCATACMTTLATTVIPREVCASKCDDAKLRCDKTVVTAKRVFDLRKNHAAKMRKVASAPVPIITK
jgi:hypothetical protein